MFEDDECDGDHVEVDQDNFNRALDHLIDSVSLFKATGGQDLTEIQPKDWGKMLETLDFARFIVSGLMYSYGIAICGHEHEEEENDGTD